MQKGKVRLTVVSKIGKEATIAIVSQGNFFGEGSLAGQLLRMGSAAAMTDCEILRVEKKTMMDALHREPALSEMFVAYLLARNIRYEEDLVDQLFNSSEKRLARVLLLLAHFGKEGIPETVVPKISQETLAEMVGTTRSRVSFFMNRFRKLGFIHYAGGVGRRSAGPQFAAQCRSPRLELCQAKKWHPLKSEDAQNKLSSEMLPLLRLLVLFRLLVLRLLFCRLRGLGLRVLLLLWRRPSFPLGRSALGLRTLARRRSQRPLSWLTPVGLWPIVRLGCRRTIGFWLSFRLRCGLSVRFRLIRFRLVWSR